MNQSHYLEKVLSRFGMADCKPLSTPCDPGLDNARKSDATPVDSTYYREIIGSLIYAMSATRPDLCYIVTKLSQNMSKPTSDDLNLAKQVLRYIKRTISHSLCFEKSENDSARMHANHRRCQKLTMHALICTRTIEAQ